MKPPRWMKLTERRVGDDHPSLVVTIELSRWRRFYPSFWWTWLQYGGWSRGKR